MLLCSDFKPLWKGKDILNPKRQNAVQWKRTKFNAQVTGGGTSVSQMVVSNHPYKSICIGKTHFETIATLDDKLGSFNFGSVKVVCFLPLKLSWHLPITKTRSSRKDNSSSRSFPQISGAILLDRFRSISWNMRKFPVTSGRNLYQS